MVEFDFGALLDNFIVGADVIAPSLGNGVLDVSAKDRTLYALRPVADFAEALPRMG